MSNYWTCAFIFRVVLPCSTALAVCIRPTMTSYVYMITGCYAPFFSIPTKKSMAGSSGTFLKIITISSTLVLCAVVSFYFALFFEKSEEYTIENCSRLENILRQGGVIQFEKLPPVDAVAWFLPEPLMVGGSTLLLLLFKRLSRDTAVLRAASTMEGNDLIIEERKRKRQVARLLVVGKYTVVGTFCWAAILMPSFLGVVYFLVFVSVLTYWACYKKLGKAFARLLVALSIFLFFHMSLIFFYQFQFFERHVEPESRVGRWLQLKRLKTMKSCEDPRLFQYHNSGVIAYIFPLVLYFLYYTSILIAKEILQANDGVTGILLSVLQRDKKPNLASKWQSTFLKVQKQLEEERYSTLFIGDDKPWTEKILSVLERVLQVFIKLSYLVSNFAMMIWAIMFIGWKSILLLFWANIIWLLPGRKQVMLRSSPFLVVWMWFLLSTAYIYSMNLTQEELPNHLGPVNLSAGINRSSPYKWLNLLIKCLFTVIICVTLRQFMQERAMEKERRKLAEAVGLSDAEAVTDFGKRKQSTFPGGKYNLLIIRWFYLYWIWVVALLFVVMCFWGMTSPLIIVFFALCALLVLSFLLLSFEYWKKFLWFFWWSVIIYTMLNLFGVYIYQFDKIRTYIHKNIMSEHMLNRMGIHKLETKQLFIALSIPLFFQIAVVIQLNYLQKGFNTLTSLDGFEPDDDDPETSGQKSYKQKLQGFKNLCYRCLELHMPKLILLCGWCLCVFDICALFVPFSILLTLSCIFGRKMSRFTIYFMSVFVMVLLVLRVIYMNQYYNHDEWNRVCQITRKGTHYNITLNGAKWLGFTPSRNGRHDAEFGSLAWSFAFVFMVTLYRVVRIRQRNYRLASDLPDEEPTVIFPEIDYKNCHDSTENMVKFFLNYGFYKFGVEITAVVGTIVMLFRMDLLASLVIVVIAISFALDRRWLAKLWIVLLLYIAVMTPVQYINSLGGWPSWCFVYWNKSDAHIRIQQLAHLMNMAYPPQARKLVFDFILLIILSRQLRVFQIEKQFRGQYYGGGTNESVAHLVDDPNFVNPIPDYNTYIRNYLDIFKQIVLNSWFYCSLLTLFLAGTMRSTIYSFGYIITAFILMWEGTELFLRPPKSIMLRWNLTLLYNISIMAFRVISQYFGCIFVFESKSVNCRLYKMLTIGCVDSFDMFKNIPDLNTKTPCTVNTEFLGIEWDCLCFFFLIFQQRIFKSLHFFHIVNNAKAHTILADRGAQLIERLRIEKRQAVDAEDDLIRENMKKKLSRIRANRQKIQGETYFQKKKSHKAVLRSGDYYLFDEVENSIDIDILPRKHIYVDPEYDHTDPMSVSEYFQLFYKSGILAVLEERNIRRLQKEAIRGLKKRTESRKALVVKSIPKPGTSNDQDPADDKTFAAVTKKMLTIPSFLWGILEACIVSFTRLLNELSSEFRKILDEMDIERRILKEKTNYSEGVRIGSNKIWNPSHSYQELLNKTSSNETHETMSFSIYMKFLRAIGYFLISQSEWTCYFAIIVNQVYRANFISLPLVLMMFCWGALTSPKPTKTYWVVTISYVLIMLLVKSIFVMDVAVWNESLHLENPFYPPTVIGLYRHGNILFNLALLGSIFFHRLVLQWLGLWKPYYTRVTSLVKDGSYTLKNGQLILSKAPGTTPSTSTGSPSKDPQALDIKSIMIPMGDYFPRSIKHGLGKYAENVRQFTQQLIMPSKTQVPVDVYTPMFLCDLVNFVIVMFFYNYFESPSEDMGFIQYLSNNRVPITFIAVVLIHFILIVIDRWIYRRKNVFAKIIFLFTQVLGYHMWLFILYPLITERNFKDEWPVQVVYIMKCLYFLFSAYQIRNGYSSITSFHCLWKNYGLFNRFGFKLYTLIPYVFEGRSLLDWTCTDTSLGVADWFKMEDITSNIFDQKCQQEFEKHMNAESGKRQGRRGKYLVGGILFFALIIIIILPFLIFSLSGAVGQTTHPFVVSMEIYIGMNLIFYSHTAEPLYKTFSQDDFDNLSRTFNNIRDTEHLFGSFNKDDVVALSWSGFSLNEWEVSPPWIEHLVKYIMAPVPLIFRLSFKIDYGGKDSPKEKKIITYSIQLPPLPHPDREKLLNILLDKPSEPALVPLILPKFVIITKDGDFKVLSIMEDPKTTEYTRGLTPPFEETDTADESSFRNILIALHRRNNKMWWEVREDCDPDEANYKYYLKHLVHNSCDEILVYFFNEKVFPSNISWVVGNGIIGMYFLYFMIVAGFLKNIFIDVAEIWIEDIPNADRILKKCMEVYVARDMENFELEEEIFSELIFIMRSREICIKLTRYEDDPYNPTFTTPGTKRR